MSDRLYNLIMDFGAKYHQIISTSPDQRGKEIIEKEVQKILKVHAAEVDKARREGYEQGVKDEVDCKVNYPHDHPQLNKQEDRDG